MDVATTKNLDDLVKVGQKLLRKPVARVNLETGIFEPSDSETNEQAIRRCVCVVFIYTELGLLILK